MTERARFLAAGHLLHRLPVLRFILSFDAVGGLNFGAAGFDDGIAAKMHDLGVMNFFYYKPPPVPSRRKVTRHFRAVTRGEHMPRLAALLRDELRARNMAAIHSLDDGRGRVAFNLEWRTRRADVKAAADAAWRRLADELHGAS